MDVVSMINKYGFPIVAAFGLGYFVFYVWTWVTKEIKPVMGEASKTLIGLIDRIRMLDNDLIRLNQKVETVMYLRSKTIERERIEAERDINQTKRKEDPIRPKRKPTKQEIKDAAGDE